MCYIRVSAFLLFLLLFLEFRVDPPSSFSSSGASLFSNLYSGAAAAAAVPLRGLLRFLWPPPHNGPAVLNSDVLLLLFLYDSSITQSAFEDRNKIRISWWSLLCVRVVLAARPPLMFLK